MQSSWRKVRSPNTFNNDDNIHQLQQSTQTVWSDEMIHTHLPIYPIQYKKNDGYKISKILFDSITPSISCVLLGESTHGTHEFFAIRSFITKYLILYRDFTCIFIELDWPKVCRLNEYVLDMLDDKTITIDDLFDDIKSYPHWMGRNTIIRELIQWLKKYNERLKENNKQDSMVSFYGIDMQCYDSLNILKQIYNKYKNILPNSIQIISFLNDLNINISHWTERQYIENQLNIIYQLFNSTKHKLLQNNENNRKILELTYNIDQNFMTLKAAINYFNNDCSWNIRDNHWFNTIEKYFQYKSNGKYVSYDIDNNNDLNKGKIILWAHNSHVCNAYFTNYSHSNIGAILKTKYGQNSVFTICFDSYKGTVTATNKRNEFAQFFIMKQNVNESYGKLWNKLCNKWNENNVMIFLKNGKDKIKEMDIKIKPKYFIDIKQVQKQTKIRDIGVCYINSMPYYHCSNGDILQIADVVIFVNQSNALEPFQCDKHKNWDKNKKSWQIQNNKTNLNDLIE